MDSKGFEYVAGGETFEAIDVVRPGARGRPGDLYGVPVARAIPLDENFNPWAGIVTVNTVAAYGRFAHGGAAPLRRFADRQSHFADALGLAILCDPQGTGGLVKGQTAGGAAWKPPPEVPLAMRCQAAVKADRSSAVPPHPMMIALTVSSVGRASRCIAVQIVECTLACLDSAAT